MSGFLDADSCGTSSSFFLHGTRATRQKDIDTAPNKIPASRPTATINNVEYVFRFFVVVVRAIFLLISPGLLIDLFSTSDVATNSADC